MENKRQGLDILEPTCRKVLILEMEALQVEWNPESNVAVDLADTEPLGYVPAGYDLDGADFGAVLFEDVGGGLF